MVKAISQSIVRRKFANRLSKAFDLEKSSIVSESLAFEDDRPAMSDRVLSNGSSIDLQIPPRVYTNNSGHGPDQWVITQREEGQEQKGTTVDGKTGISY